MYDIVDQHLQQTLGGESLNQLQMIIPGEGGTGKSHTIEAISSNFAKHNVGNWLVKGAYTRTAASIINGSTLHVLTGMPIQGLRSSQSMKKLRVIGRRRNIL